MDLSWMAWTWPTIAFFLFILTCLVGMGIWEKYSPGGNPRRGIFRIDTTRGDRLFITLVGSAFIFMGWLWLFSTPLWGGLIISLIWGFFVFKLV
jgi:predicted small integral membrane protein